MNNEKTAAEPGLPWLYFINGGQDGYKKQWVVKWQCASVARRSSILLCKIFQHKMTDSHSCNS